MVDGEKQMRTPATHKLAVILPYNPDELSLAGSPTVLRLQPIRTPSDRPSTMAPPSGSLSHPDYPLIDADPHFSRVMRYLRPTDYIWWAGATASFPVLMALWGRLFSLSLVFTLPGNHV